MQETGWAIMGNCGLYYGWAGRRVDAIAQHVHHVEGAEPSWVTGQGLNAEQDAAWQKCRARGDRAVKVTVTVID